MSGAFLSERWELLKEASKDKIYMEDMKKIENEFKYADNEIK